MSRRFFTEEQKDTLIEVIDFKMARDGATLTEVAGDHGITRHLYYMWTKARKKTTTAKVKTKDSKMRKTSPIKAKATTRTATKTTNVITHKVLQAAKKEAKETGFALGLAKGRKLAILDAKKVLNTL